MTVLALRRKEPTPVEAATAFDRRIADLGREINAMARESAAALSELERLELDALATGRDTDRGAARLRRRVAELDARLAPKRAALATANSARVAAIRPIAEATFARLAAERDQRHARHLALLSEELGLVERVAEIDAQISDLEYADILDVRAQERAIHDGQLACRPARTLSDGVLVASVDGLVAQVRHALVFNRAP